MHNQVIVHPSLLLVSLLGLLALHFGCAPAARAAPPEQPEAAAPPPAPEVAAHEIDEDQALCPTDLPDVRAQARDVEGGVAIAFTGPADRVDAIRELTLRMATAYQRCQHMMREHHEEMMHRRPRGRMQRPDAPRMGRMRGPRGPMRMMLGAEIQVRERTDGAEIVMLAERPEHVDALRARERWHVEMMRLGHCPMMGMMLELEEPTQGEPHHQE